MHIYLFFGVIRCAVHVFYKVDVNFSSEWRDAYISKWEKC